jgi:hypothetical protein
VFNEKRRRSIVHLPRRVVVRDGRTIPVWPSDSAGVEDLLESYPHLSKADVRAAIACAADSVSGEETVAVAMPTPRETRRQEVRFLADESLEGRPRCPRNQGTSREA